MSPLMGVTCSLFVLCSIRRNFHVNLIGDIHLSMINCDINRLKEGVEANFLCGIYLYCET